MSNWRSQQTSLATVLLLLVVQPVLAGPGPGSLDRTFVPQERAGAVFTTAEQPDGKVFIGGWFGVLRLLPDGQTDASYADLTRPLPAANGVPLINCVVVQPDGKVLVGGQFEVPHDPPLINLARFSPDGRVDETFSPGASPNSPVERVIVQPDGRILIGGRFGAYGSNAVPKIARLWPDGRLDRSFDPGRGPDEFVMGMLLQPDGKLLVHGNFSRFGDVSRRGLARLNSDGSIDATFDPAGLDFPWCAGFALQEDKVLVSAWLSLGGGPTAPCLLRLHPDGTLDRSFNAQLNQLAQSIVVDRAGKVLIGGFFTEADGVPRSGVARLERDGKLDRSFDPDGGISGTIDSEWDGPAVYSLRLLRAGKLLAGGNFAQFDGQPRSGVARLVLQRSSRLDFVPPRGRDLPRVRLTGEAGQVYRLEVSTDFRNWSPWITVTNLTGSVEIPDPAAAPGSRFYRASSAE